jgi:hypothetical protein
MAIIMMPPIAAGTSLAKEFWLAAWKESYSNADRIGTITDWSGNGRDFTQATAANKPRFDTNVLNGQPGFWFDGSAYFAERNAFLSGNAEMMLVLKIPNPANAMLSGFMKMDGATSASHFAFSGTAYSAWGGTNRTSYTPAQATMEAGMLTHIQCVSGTSNWKWYENGSTLRQSQTQTINWGTGASPKTKLGASSTNSDGSGQSNWFKGWFMELMIWNRQLTTAERNAELAILRSRYGLTLTDF